LKTIKLLFETFLTFSELTKNSLLCLSAVCREGCVNGDCSMPGECKWVDSFFWTISILIFGNLVSILPTFYASVFLYESLCAAFFYPCFSFVIFGTKILYKEPVHKTLMKLTPGLFLMECNEMKLNLLVRGHSNNTWHFD